MGVCVCMCVCGCACVVLREQARTCRDKLPLRVSLCVPVVVQLEFCLSPLHCCDVSSVPFSPNDTFRLGHHGLSARSLV